MRQGGLVRILGLIASAAIALAGCEDSPKVAYKELLDDDPHVRADAALRLGQARAGDAVDSLLAVIDDPDEEVRVQTILALGHIGDSRAVPAIVEKIEDPLRSVRVAACQALGEIGDPRGVEPLSALLYSSDDRLRLVAARNIGFIPDPVALETLVRIALQDEDEMVRQHVVRVIGDRQARDAIPLVESALVTESDLVRANAAMVLGDLGDVSSVPALLEALDDPFYKVRGLAVHSLVKLDSDSEEVVEALRERLQVETNGMVQVDIAWSLARLGDRSNIDVIRANLFKGQPEDVRAEAAMALGDIGDPDDIGLLEKAMDDKKGLVRRQVFLAIQKLKEA